MRRRLVAAAMFVAALPLAGSCARASRAAGASVTISIVGTNDLHGAMLADDGRGGLALFGGYVDNLRAAREADGGAVLLIDAGDMWQGTLESNLSEGAAVVAAYDRLGYAAVAIGNHEFDYGPAGPAATPRGLGDDARGALKARAAEASFPFLAANIVDEATGVPVAWPNVRPSAIARAAGVPVGVIGVTTIETLRATHAANTLGLAIRPLAPAIAAEAERLRNAGAAVVIVAAHAGGSCQAFDDPADASSCGAADEIVRVARDLRLGLVDVIVAGHTHARMAHEINGIAVIQSGSRGRAFGRVDVEVDPATGGVLGRRLFPPQPICAFTTPSRDACVQASRSEPGDRTAYEGQPVTADDDLDRIVAEAEADVISIKTRDLGVFVEDRLPIRGGVESPLGNLFVDLLLEAVPGADVAVNNTDGGLRADLPAGPFTYGRLYEVSPFDNRLAELELTGAELERTFARQIERSGSLVGVAGVRVTARCAGGSVAVSLEGPHGPVGRSDRLRVATPDYLASGVFFAPAAPAGGFVLDPAAPLVRDLVADALRRRRGVLRAADLVDDARPRWPPRNQLPLRCR